MGQRVQVKYHRAILDSQRRVKYPSGAIIDSDDVPAGMEDRVFNLPDVPDAVTKIDFEKKTVTFVPRKEAPKES